MTDIGAPSPAVAHLPHPLDNPVWASLTGPHEVFSIGGQLGRRYRADVSPFAAVADLTDPGAWAALLDVVAPAETVAIAGSIEQITREWEVLGQGPGVQMVATAALESCPDEEAQVLGASDVAAMLELVTRTKPGPFLPSTYLLGTYLGIRREAKLIAMAGERMRLAGWTEISAVCTDAGFRGQGLATRLVRAVADVVRQRGDVPFLHAAASNRNAIALYESIGFELRRPITFAGIRPK